MNPDPRTKLNELFDLIRRYRIKYLTEDQMQRQVESIIAGAGLPCCREMILEGGGRLDLGVAYPVVLNEDREVWKNWKEKVDFGLPFVIAVECKVKGSLYDLLRQCSGYIQHPDVQAVLVVTSRQAHREMPTELHGKPVAVVWVGANVL